MSKFAWTPWHQVIQLRDDIKSGELSMATFAADLYDVVMGRAKPVYQIPAEFFGAAHVSHVQPPRIGEGCLHPTRWEEWQEDRSRQAGS